MLERAVSKSIFKNGLSIRFDEVIEVCKWIKNRGRPRNKSVRF